MPYIEEKDRERVRETLIPAELTTGELNYRITDILVRWLGPQPHYCDFNNAIGVLECAKLELYRRLAAPYEEQKCHDNGDVYKRRS